MTMPYLSNIGKKKCSTLFWHNRLLIMYFMSNFLCNILYNPFTDFEDRMIPFWKGYALPLNRNSSANVIILSRISIWCFSPENAFLLGFTKSYLIQEFIISNHWSINMIKSEVSLQCLLLSKPFLWQNSNAFATDEESSWTASFTLSFIKKKKKKKSKAYRLWSSPRGCLQ